MSGLQYAPFISDIDLPFYSSLANSKINHDMLDDSVKRVLGVYEVRPADSVSRSCRMQILANALTSNETVRLSCRAEGIIKNFNTIEDYRNFDKTQFLQTAGKQIWDAICDGTILSCPSLLASFAIIAFANLKRYHFTQWFAFPALHSNPPWKPTNSGGPLFHKLTSSQTVDLVAAIGTWRCATKDERQHGFFLASRFLSTANPQPLSSDARSNEDRPLSAGSEVSQAGELGSGYRWEIGTLAEYENGFFDEVAAEDQFVCFMDPSNFPENPGWMLRNLLVLIKQRFKINRVQILCYRDTHGTRETPHSLILNLETASHPLLAGQPQALTSQLADLTINSAQHQEREADMPKVTGWERNPQGKLAAKTVDLSLYLDPVKLAEQASDLNLKLIKWRLVPDINLDIIKSKKYLLLGAGTLGSNVARLLLGWGARKITFVDNAKVSLSNPVRQSLFTFDNARGGGVSKAQCAAEALRLVSPSVEAEGHALTVPMAGHPIMDETATRSDLEKLERLIDEHDVLFLLMDTRESRWLPTVIGRAKDKLVLNAALGFDSWLAMRHGVDDTIGCYFCNDVVAPADSLKDATLDQQCTVTRPGVAYFASAALVEICVSMLQSPMLGRAKPPGGLMGARKKGGVVEEAEARNVLGVVPHQLRGFLSNFTTMCIQGPAYSSCSACSPRILEEYRREGFDFVKKALNERGYVEELSGLAEVHRLAEAADVDFGEEEDGEGDLDEEILL